MNDGVENFVGFEEASHRTTWLLSYADIVTLFLTFFVLLLSMSKVSSSRYESLARAFGNTPERSLAEVRQEVEEVIQSTGLDEHVHTELNDDGLYIELENAVLFAAGDAELTDEAAALVRPIGAQLAGSLEDRYQIVVEGHTDDVPIHNTRFHSNWELSTSRAIYVMEQLADAGFPQARLSVQGFADTRARHTADSGASAEERASDRRVVLRVVDVTPPSPRTSAPAQPNGGAQ
jgi:chemotaxis protein MotB